MPYCNGCAQGDSGVGQPRSEVPLYALVFCQSGSRGGDTSSRARPPSEPPRSTGSRLYRPRVWIVTFAAAIELGAILLIVHRSNSPTLRKVAHSNSAELTTTSSMNQPFGFSYPTYGATLSLEFAFEDRGAKAEMGTALVSRRSDLYTERQLREQVMLDVSNAVHQLEQAKLSIAAGKEALELAKKNTAAEQRKYELGQGTIVLVLEAQTEQDSAEQTFCRPKSAIRSLLPASIMQPANC